MTLFEELGVEYKEVDGILYPLLSVDEAEYNLMDIGKYGRMWLRYMKENKPSEYRHMARMGQLRKQAETAYVSVAKDSDHPLQMVVNAFTRRGVKVYKTEGNIIHHHKNMPDREGWSALEKLNFEEKVEEWDK